MRAFLALLLSLCLVFLPVGSARAQTSLNVPNGIEEIPGYDGLYVIDASRFLASAFVVIMLTEPRDVRAFLSGLQTCASDDRLTARLRNEGLRTRQTPSSEVFSALRTGTCDIFVGPDFNFAQLDRRLNSDDDQSDDVGQGPTDNPAQNDDVDVDRTPPDVSPTQTVFEGTGRSIIVTATITDIESGIREAFVVTANGERIQMSAPQRSPNYAATVELPRDFDDAVVTIVATNNADRSARSRVSLRLLPWCGPRAVVGQSLVQDVQENLSCVGISPGATDGALGPNTCTAIGNYLGNRMSRFDGGRIGWAELQQELSTACLAAQPVELDVPGQIEVDSDQTTVRVSLVQPGITDVIRIAGAGVGMLTQTWRGQPLSFDLPMPRPGEDAAYRVQALGPNGDALDTATLRLTRPAAAIAVRPSGAVTGTGPRTDFSVAVTSGASAIALIEARQPNADPISQQYVRQSTVLSLRTPDPGTSQRITFAALDRGGNVLATQTVVLSGPEPVEPTRLTLESPAGSTIDAATARLRVVLDAPGAATALVMRGGQGMTELARAGVSDSVWEVDQELPPPGGNITFQVEALDRTGSVLVSDSLRIERTAVRMQVQPSGQIEADTGTTAAQVQISSGADWITTIVARGTDDGLTLRILDETALENAEAELQLDMPAPGETRLVEVVALGRDGNSYATTQLTLIRPAIVVPVAVIVTSPDGFAVDAQSTRLNVQVVEPADTALIVVSDRLSGQVFHRVRYTGDDWLGQVLMPEPGEDLSLVVEAQSLSGETLATSQIRLLRPAAATSDLPNWVWIGGLIFAALGLGFLGAKVAAGRASEPGADLKPPPPHPNIFAEPDQDPVVRIDPVSPPTLLLRIDQDQEPDVEIEMEHDEGAP